METKQLEERFNGVLGRWKEHCRRNSVHSFAQPYLDCDAYREIVAMGLQVLPLIRDQLNGEYETAMNYENELKRLKIKVFGTDSVKLFGENYDKIREDDEYQQYEARYHNDVIGNPGIHWCHAIKEIVPEFGLPIGKKDSGQPVERVAPGFVGLKVDEVQKATINWLDENIDKYLQR